VFVPIGVFAFVACGVAHDTGGLPDVYTGATGPGRGCDYQGAHYDDGQDIPGGCPWCTCHNGDIDCSLVICPAGGGASESGGQAGEMDSRGTNAGGASGGTTKAGVGGV
jgi:hypothetical protein